MSGQHDKESLRREAADWFARLRAPDGDRSRLDFERWRAADPRRRAAYAELEDIWKLSGALGQTDLGRARGLQPRRTWWGGATRFALAGAVAAILLAVGAIWLQRRAAPVVAANTPAASAVGQIRTVHLSDGSTVTLDTDSEIDVAFSADERRIRLIRGRARFDVAHEPGRPFLVAAGGRTVIARGTLFDVWLSREGVRVSLYRGAVDVRGASPIEGAVRVAHLTSGQSLVVAAPDATPRIAPAVAGTDRWVSGLLSFQNVPLADALDQANRYSTRKISLGSPALGQLRVTGAFRPLPTDALAASLAKAFALHVETAPDGSLVLEPH